jgi:hypothetical protein
VRNIPAQFGHFEAPRANAVKETSLHFGHEIVIERYHFLQEVFSMAKGNNARKKETKKPKKDPKKK